MVDRIAWGSLVFGMAFIAIGIAVIAEDTSTIGAGLGPAVALLIGGGAVLVRIVVSSRTARPEPQDLDVEPQDLD